MRQSFGYAAALAFAASVSLPALAAPPAAESAAQQSADHDFSKLSADGGKALRDIRTVRLEIFDGQIKGAKADIAKAIASLNKAQSDDTIFTKAESELKVPANMKGDTKNAANASTTPIQWLPVDGGMTLGEDFVATPEKTAGVAKANDKLAKGDKKGAMEDLKLANIDVNFLVELAPLKATEQGVKQASAFLDDGKYYEANQALKSVEDGMRFDTENVVGTPEKVDASRAMKTSG
jgi:hypothetical protein